jgi:hypothetical protein
MPIGYGIRDQPRKGPDAQLLCAAGFHEDGGRGAVGGLRGVAGGDGALRVECRLELGESFSGGVGAWAFVG